MFIRILTIVCIYQNEFLCEFHRYLPVKALASGPITVLNNGLSKLASSPKPPRCSFCLLLELDVDFLANALSSVLYRDSLDFCLLLRGTRPCSTLKQTSHTQSMTSGEAA